MIFVNLLISIYLYIRDNRSKYQNKRYDEYIIENEYLKEKITRIENRIKNCSTESQVVNIYNEIFMDYRSDPYKGIYDWSPSLSTVIVKGNDDCDGSSAVWEILGRKYLEINNLKPSSIGSYSFICLDFKNFKRTHVMCIAETNIGLWLFDYETIRVFKTWEDIKLYYKEAYTDRKISLDRIFIRKIPFYKSVEFKL